MAFILLENGSGYGAPLLWSLRPTKSLLASIRGYYQHGSGGREPLKVIDCCSGAGLRWTECAPGGTLSYS